MPTPTDSLIEYPCDFPIKIMGRRDSGFTKAVIEIVQRHAPDFMPGTLEMRPSREGKYVSLTATVNATSQEQIDALYRTGASVSGVRCCQASPAVRAGAGIRPIRS